MKYVLVLLMMLSSFGVMGRDYFKSIDDVMSDSPYCLDNKLGSGIGIAKSEGSFQGMPPGYFCEKCKDDAKKKRINLKRTTNLKDAYGKGSKDKQTDNHYRCLPPKTKDPFVCAVKVGKTKIIAVKVKDGVMPRAGSEYAVVGSKTFESKSDAKKSEECKIEVKYVCVREIGKKKAEGIKVEDAKKNASKYEVIGSSQFDSKKEAKKDPACDTVPPKFVCAREIGKKKAEGITVEEAKTNASKYEVIGSSQFDSKKEAKKDPACDTVAGVCKVVDAVGSFAKDAQLDKKQVKEYKRACKDAKGKFSSDKDANTCGCELPTETDVADFNCYYCDPRESNKVWTLKIGADLVKKYNLDVKSQTRCEDIKKKKISKKALVNEDSLVKFKNDYKEIKKWLMKREEVWTKVKSSFSSDNVDGFKLFSDANEAMRVDYCKKYHSDCVVDGKTLLESEVDDLEKQTLEKNELNDGNVYTFDRSTCVPKVEAVLCSSDKFKNSVIKLADGIYETSKKNFLPVDFSKNSIKDLEKNIESMIKAFYVDFTGELNKGFDAVKVYVGKISAKRDGDSIKVVDSLGNECRSYSLDKPKPVEIKMTFGVKYDSCEYELKDLSFDDIRSLPGFIASKNPVEYATGSTIGGRTVNEHGNWETALPKINDFVSQIYLASKLGLSCELSVNGYASNTDVSGNCKKYHNAKTDKDANQTIATKRATFAMDKIAEMVENYKGQNANLSGSASCKKGETCGVVRITKKKANTASATNDQGFDAKAVCK